MKQFNTTINGYDKIEVNAFVEEVTKEYEKVLEKLRQSEIENKSLRDRVEYYKNLVWCLYISLELNTLQNPFPPL